MPRHTIPPMRLRDLARGVDGASISGDPDTVVTGVTSDSRDVAPGDLFFCVHGGMHDGHRFAAVAVGAGACALVVDDPSSLPPGCEVPMIEVASVRRTLGVLAANAFGHPAAAARMVGVTGTNGKTSTVAILSSILRASGEKVLTIGTLTGERTTPEALDLHAMIRSAVDDGVTCVVMEVSSHALAMHRVDGIRFEVGVFTNLGRDHLDFHGSHEDYAEAKARLFDASRCSLAVVNGDDAASEGMLRTAGDRTYFSISDAGDARVEADRVAFTWDGQRVSLPVGGAFMLVNALAAATAARAMGVSTSRIVDGCANLPRITGRFESVGHGSDISVVVDYAHTPEAMRRVLSTARDVAEGRVVVVFGCGGDRDRGKRPLMGRAAGDGADLVYVTSDNPRSEPPGAIIDEIISGIVGPREHVIDCVDRAQAVESAILGARRGDIVVIAGKGHETWQEIDGRRVPFDDAEVARAALRRRAMGDMSAVPETGKENGE